MENKAKTKGSTNVFSKSARLFRDIKSELKKVIWPTRQQLINNTLTVLLSCLIIGAIIWIADGCLQVIRNWVYKL